MKLPEYITTDEVKRICRELQIRDWTELAEPIIELEEAQKIQQVIGAEAAEISAAAFQKGLEVELEHGMTFADANVTNNHPILTGLIVLAHLKEMLDYYERLEVAELEGDLLKALRQQDPDKAERKYRALVAARAQLAANELAQLMKP